MMCPSGRPAPHNDTKDPRRSLRTTRIRRMICRLILSSAVTMVMAWVLLMRRRFGTYR